jgi:hypothetical protein
MKRFKRLLFSCNTSLYICILSMKERESKIKEEHTKKQVQEKERKTARGKQKRQDVTNYIEIKKT